MNSVWRATTLVVIVTSSALLVLLSGGLTSATSLGGAGTVTSPTSAYASAQLGHLTLTSAVLFEHNDVRFLGGWSSPAASCQATRRVVVVATLAYSSPSYATNSTRMLRWHRVGDVTNCGESGPNFGVNFPASRSLTSCSNGQWRPGQYLLTSTAIVTAPNGSTPDTTLRVTADLTTTEIQLCP